MEPQLFTTPKSFAQYHKVQLPKRMTGKECVDMIKHLESLKQPPELIEETTEQYRMDAMFGILTDFLVHETPKIKIHSKGFAKSKFLYTYMFKGKSIAFNTTDPIETKKNYDIMKYIIEEFLKLEW